GARIHLGKDGSITLLTGKVEGGQGARGELMLAAAEEMRVPVNVIQVVMADTALVPDDGITAGSRSTPGTVPAVRQAAATAREYLIGFAAKTWNVDRKTIEVRDGKAADATNGRSLSYSDLAANEQAIKAFAECVPAEAGLTDVKEWKTL